LGVGGPPEDAFVAGVEDEPPSAIAATTALVITAAERRCKPQRELPTHRDIPLLE
jgi:hypothetical protein